MNFLHGSSPFARVFLSSDCRPKFDSLLDMENKEELYGVSVIKVQLNYTIILHKSVCLSVGVRKLQDAILARSSREMSLNDRIVWQYILSRVRVSVRPSNFCIREKPPNSQGNRVAKACCLFQWPCYGLWMPAERAVTGGRLWIALTCTAGCVLAHACACIRWHACVRDVFAIYDNKIWPTDDFIQIRHTDDFPSKGTRLVLITLDVPQLPT